MIQQKEQKDNKDRIQKSKLLIHRCVKYLGNDDIILLMKDHGLYTNDNSVISLIEQVKREALLYAKYTRRDSINNNLVSYKVTSLYNAAKTRAKANNIAFSLSTE